MQSTMKRISYKLLAAVIAPFLTTACIEEAFPEGATQVQEQVSNSDFALEGVVNSFQVAMMQVDQSSFYSKYGTQADFGIPAMHIMTDSMLEDIALQGSNPGYYQFYYWAYNLGMNDQSWPIGYFWEHYYSYIKIANDLINMIAESEDMPALEKIYLGQAYAYRAMCYLDLARMYEFKANKYTTPKSEQVYGLTVPIVDENITQEKAENNPRVSREVMYEFIIGDLEKAEVLIANAPNLYSNPNLAAVYGMYARLYLEMGYWENAPEDAFALAAEYARKAITTSGRTPLTEEQWTDPINGFNNGAANNSWIWGLTVENDLLGNLIAFHAHLSGEALWGYSFYSYPGINKALYDKIKDADFRKKSWLDPDTSTWTSGRYRYAGTPTTQEEFLNYAIPYHAIKFRPAQGEMEDYTVGNPADCPLMRVEEMYFIEMEAVANKDLSEGIALLNTFMNTYRISDNSYDCTNLAVDFETFTDEMLVQKRVEFWGEGILFYDYKRLDKGITRKYDGTNHPAIWQFNTEGRSPQWNFVINRGEFQANAGINEETNNPDPSGLLVVPAN